MEGGCCGGGEGGEEGGGYFVVDVGGEGGVDGWGVLEEFWVRERGGEGRGGTYLGETRMFRLLEAWLVVLGEVADGGQGRVFGGPVKKYDGNRSSRSLKGAWYLFGTARAY